MPDFSNVTVNASGIGLTYITPLIYGNTLLFYHGDLPFLDRQYGAPEDCSCPHLRIPHR